MFAKHAPRSGFDPHNCGGPGLCQFKVSWLHSSFEVSLNYVRYHLKTKNTGHMERSKETTKPLPTKREDFYQKWTKQTELISCLDQDADFPKTSVSIMKDHAVNVTQNPEEWGSSVEHILISLDR